MYMSMPFSPPRTRTHDLKHKKKLGPRSCQTKLNKLNLLLPIPDCQMNSIYYSLQYDRRQSRADKNSASSNHTSHKKHHDSCHLNPSVGTKRYAAKMKTEGGQVVNSVLQANSNLKSVQAPKQKVSPTFPVQKAYST